MGGDTDLRGHKFKSHDRIFDGSFSHLNAV